MDPALRGPGTGAAAQLARRHRIVVVGGGAGGLELATRLGDKLGRRGKADITLIDKASTHLWKPLLHEIAAGSMDLGHHELDYLAQAHWHRFHYRTGEMIGLDRNRREVLVGPVVEEDGTEVTPARGYPYDTLVLAVGSLTNDFGTPGVMEHAICLETPEQAARIPPPAGRRLLARAKSERAVAAGSAPGRHRRRRRHRRRTCRRTAQDDARAGGVWPRSHQSRQGHQTARH